MIRLEPLQQHHVDRMEFKSYDEENLADMITDAAVMVELSYGFAFAAVDDHGVLGIGGIMPEHDGMCQAWSFVSPRAGRAKIGLTKAVAAVLAKVKAEFERIECSCLITEQHERWLRLLGFNRECVRRKYGPDGSDFGLWSIVT